jgi:two-component system LytT family response regulator
MKLRALIIDDEHLARLLVKKYCIDCGMIEIVGQATNGFEALQLINDLKPDIIFLDIQMPGLTGFGLLELIDEPPFIVFVTAYDEFAVKAFEKNAVDYLLKPVEYDRFFEAVKKADERVSAKIISKNLTDNLTQLRKDFAPFISSISVKDKGNIVIIKIDDITYFEAMDDYVSIHFKDKKLLKKETLKNLEEKLDPTVFVKIHRSFLINIRFLDKILGDGGENYRAILKNGAQLSVSKSGLQKLKSIIT